MALFFNLRSLVFLRRAARALERIADAQERQTQLMVEEAERQMQKTYRPQPKPMEVGMFSQVAASREWRRQQVESGQTTVEELEEEYGPLPEDK